MSLKTGTGKLENADAVNRMRTALHLPVNTLGIVDDIIRLLFTFCGNVILRHSNASKTSINFSIVADTF